MGPPAVGNTQRVPAPHNKRCARQAGRRKPWGGGRGWGAAGRLAGSETESKAGNKAGSKAENNGRNGGGQGGHWGGAGWVARLCCAGWGGLPVVAVTE